MEIAQFTPDKDTWRPEWRNMFSSQYFVHV